MRPYEPWLVNSVGRPFCAVLSPSLCLPQSFLTLTWGWTVLELCKYFSVKESGWTRWKKEVTVQSSNWTQRSPLSLPLILASEAASGFQSALHFQADWTQMLTQAVEVPMLKKSPRRLFPGIHLLLAWVKPSWDDVTLPTVLSYPVTVYPHFLKPKTM